ncbi:uncharacterized protein LOC144073617 isoform X1 [Stigmatopora argus]
MFKDRHQAVPYMKTDYACQCSEGFHPFAVCRSIYSQVPLQQHLCTATMATTEAMIPDHEDFEYDEETLRTTGLVLAIIMFVAGILIALNPLTVQYQRQMCPHQLFSKSNMLLKEREGGAIRIQAYNMHKSFMPVGSLPAYQ